MSFTSKTLRKKDRIKFSQSLDLTSNNFFRFNLHKTTKEFSTTNKYKKNFLNNPYFKLYLESELGNNTKKERIKMLEYIYEIPLLNSSKDSKVNSTNKASLSIRKICKKMKPQKNLKLKCFDKKMGKQQMKNEANSLDITDFVNSSLLESDNENVVLFEGELYRYHPGFTVHYYKKFCQITKKEFRYFNQSNPKFNENPVLSVPLIFIESVKQVDFEIPEEKILKQKENYSNPHLRNMFQFEIYIKDKYKVSKCKNSFGTTKKVTNFHRRNQKSIEICTNFKNEIVRNYRKRNICTKHSTRKEQIYLTVK